MSEVTNEIATVKIQRSIYSTAEGESVLIYTENRDFHYQGPLPLALKEMMGDRLKIYCESELIPDLDEEGQTLGTFKFAIIKEVEEQSW